jgi:hypothetical protein
LALQGGVESGEQALGGGFLVAGGAVDLAGEEQAADGLGFQRGIEAARVEVVVLDGVAGPQDVGVLQAGDGVHEVQLHVEGQAGGDAVRVDLVRVRPSGSRKIWWLCLVGEAVDLVLDGGAVARAHSFDDARKHGRAVQPAADDVVRALGGMRDPAGQLLRMLRSISEEGEHRRRVVARLHGHHREIDAAAVEARRRAGLQAAGRQLQLAQARGQADAGGIAHAAGLVVVEADVDQAGEEGAGGQHHGFGLEAQAELGDGAGDAVAGDGEVVDGLPGTASGWAGSPAGGGSPPCTARGRPGRAWRAPPVPCWN